MKTCPGNKSKKTCLQEQTSEQIEEADRTCTMNITAGAGVILETCTMLRTCGMCPSRAPTKNNLKHPAKVTQFLSRSESAWPASCRPTHLPRSCKKDSIYSTKGRQSDEHGHDPPHEGVEGLGKRLKERWMTVVIDSANFKCVDLSTYYCNCRTLQHDLWWDGCEVGDVAEDVNKSDDAAWDEDRSRQVSEKRKINSMSYNLERKKLEQNTTGSLFTFLGLSVPRWRNSGNSWKLKQIDLCVLF